MKIMLRKIAVSCCATWSRNQKSELFRMVNCLFHTKAYAGCKHFESLLALDFVSRYNPQTIKQVLNVLNSTDEKELQRYDITKGRFESVDKYRRKNGPFKSIEQILEVDGFGIRILEKLVVSIIEGPKANKTESNKISKLMRDLVTPVLDGDKKSSIHSVTSICINAKHISWAHMETNGELLSWDSYTGFEWPKKNATAHLHDLALEVRNRLPISDIYVMEGVDMQMHHLNYMQSYTIFLNLQRILLSTMLLSLIATKFDRSKENGSHWEREDKFYFLRQKVMSQLFQLIVGNESVSTDNLVTQIITKNIAKKFQHILSVNMDFSELQMYENSDPFEKEALGQALLLSVAFIDLILHRNPNSLDSLTIRKRDGVYR